jgi:hypothetical protein
MTTKEFIELVKDMRTQQRTYFGTRSKESLVKSKDLEAKVDLHLRNLTQIEMDF